MAGNCSRLAQAADLAVVEPAPGVTRRVISGDKLMLAVITIAPAQSVAAHAHPHEQIGCVVTGRVHFRIGDQSTVLSAGGIYSVPSGVEHAAENLATETATLIDVFTPIREDFLS